MSGLQRRFIYHRDMFVTVAYLVALLAMAQVSRCDLSRVAQTLVLVSASRASRYDPSRPSVHGSRKEQGELGVRGSGLGVRELENADSKFKDRASPESEAGKAGIRDTGHGDCRLMIVDCRLRTQRGLGALQIQGQSCAA